MVKLDIHNFHVYFITFLHGVNELWKRHILPLVKYSASRYCKDLPMGSWFSTEFLTDEGDKVFDITAIRKHHDHILNFKIVINPFNISNIIFKSATLEIIDNIYNNLQSAPFENVSKMLIMYCDRVGGIFSRKNVN